MVYCIVYLSSSRVMFEETELAGVVEQSRKNNAASDITGALLYCNGSIIQVLEGEEQAVNTLFEKIKWDHRHSRVTLLYQGPVDSRSFQSWAMGYITMDKRNMEELKDQLAFIDNPHTSESTGNKIVSLLQTFFRNNYRN